MPRPASSSRPRPWARVRTASSAPTAASIARDFTPLPRAVDGGDRGGSRLLRAPRSWTRLVVGGVGTAGRRSSSIVGRAGRGGRRRTSTGSCSSATRPRCPRSAVGPRDPLRNPRRRHRGDCRHPVTGSAGYLGDVPGVDIRVHIVAAGCRRARASLAAVEQLAPIGEGVFVWAAGEASALVAVRRHLRRDPRAARQLRRSSAATGDGARWPSTTTPRSTRSIPRVNAAQLGRSGSRSAARPSCAASAASSRVGGVPLRRARGLRPTQEEHRDHADEQRRRRQQDRLGHRGREAVDDEVGTASRRCRSRRRSAAPGGSPRGGSA